MKKFSFLLGAVVLFLLLPGASSAEVAPPAAGAAAEAGLVKFLTEVIPPSGLVNFGFAAGEDVSGASLGDPWLLHTITPDALRAATAETAVTDLVTPTGLWYFPVLLSGTPRCVITVTRVKGKWEAVGIGKAPLAVELGKISTRWPKQSGYTPKLVAVNQAAAYFFTVPEGDPGNLTPLTFDGLGFGGWYQKTGPEYSSTAELSELLSPLKAAVEANISGRRPEGKGGEE